jgi:negative regulator of sigma E activity
MTNRDYIQRQLSAYLDGELDARDAADVEQALAGDAELTRELEQLRATRELLRRMPIEHAPEDFTSRLLEQVERRHLVHLHAPAKLGINWLRYAVTAAVAMIAVSVGVLTFVSIYSASKVQRNSLAHKSGLNTESPETATLATISGKEAGGKFDELDSQNNYLICTDSLPRTKRELESELRKNSIQPIKQSGSGDEEVSYEVEVDHSQATQLKLVVDNLRNNNLGAELSRRQVVEEKLREKAADAKCKDIGARERKIEAACADGYAEAALKKSQTEDKNPARRDEKQGGTRNIGKTSGSPPAPGSVVTKGGDYYKQEKELRDHGKLAKPSASSPGGEPTSGPALADNSQCPTEEQNQSAQPSKRPATQLAVTTEDNERLANATSPSNAQNSNRYAQRIMITLQYHPSITQSQAGQNLDAPFGVGFNPSTQARAAENAASKPAQAKQILNR